MKIKTILLFGPPGAGKGTQGKVLGTIPSFYHLACGDAFRSLTIESELARLFLDYSGKGLLVPDEYTVRLWRESLEKRIQSGQFVPDRDILVLDGIPRNVNQAQLLQNDIEVHAVFSLFCLDRSKLIRRLQRRALRDNRLDDANLEVINERLVTYERETKPVMDFYGEGLVHLVDATQTPAQVLHHILEVVADIHTPIA